MALTARGSVIVAAAAATLLAGAWLVFFDRNSAQQVESAESLLLGSTLQGEAGDEQFAQAIDVHSIEFPRDHGPHPDFRTEWWYFTGNLTTDDSEHFGYQFTIFRRAAALSEPDLDSDWASSQVFLAQIGLTDASAGLYLVDEMYSRGALELAGAREQPFAVWVNDWIAEGREGGCEGCLDLGIKAFSDAFSLDLTLSSQKPAVLQGDRGLSQKGNSAGNASYYYSLTRMKTTGNIAVRGVEKAVSGDSWMDHEWFSSVLGADDDVGWDWFSIQLDDNREFMFFQIRSSDDSESLKYGIAIDSKGHAEQIAESHLRFTKLQSWKSGFSEAEYPVRWNIEIPQRDMRLNIEPVIEAQERIDSFRYWEGAILVNGIEAGRELSGKGYLEMTGY